MILPRALVVTGRGGAVAEDPTILPLRLGAADFTGDAMTEAGKGGGPREEIEGERGSGSPEPGVTGVEEEIEPRPGNGRVA